ncbi:MAG: hypothetical protein ACREYB_07320 [Casimicrobiaceae bacterium]
MAVLGHAGASLVPAPSSSAAGKRAIQSSWPQANAPFDQDQIGLQRGKVGCRRFCSAAVPNLFRVRRIDDRFKQSPDYRRIFDKHKPAKPSGISSKI